mmetsp:Transcript_22735/g.53940  ORF Transcript_22735/g.53940 Transcript_22735/m.53940 type:complete len:269 (+) Transcript_22735:335-1141(+)
MTARCVHGESVGRRGHLGARSSQAHRPSSGCRGVAAEGVARRCHGAPVQAHSTAHTSSPVHREQGSSVGARHRAARFAMHGASVGFSRVQGEVRAARGDESGTRKVHASSRRHRGLVEVEVASGVVRDGRHQRGNASAEAGLVVLNGAGSKELQRGVGPHASTRGRRDVGVKLHRGSLPRHAAGINTRTLVGCVGSEDSRRQGKIRSSANATDASSVPNRHVSGEGGARRIGQHALKDEDTSTVNRSSVVVEGVHVQRHVGRSPCTTA